MKKHVQFKEWLAMQWADLHERPGLWASRFVLLLGPWASFWMVELLNQNNIFGDLYAWQVLMNMIWYYLIYLVCRLITGQNRRGAALAAVLTFAFGMVNHYVLRFRGRILFPADVAGWKTAANVAKGFDFSFDPYIVEACVLLVTYLFLVLACPRHRGRDRLPASAAVILWTVTVGYIVAFFFTPMLPALGIYTQQWVTQRNGFLLNFTTALRYSSVDKPSDYSKDKVLELAEQFPSLEGKPKEERPTNIVVVMNESFADFSVFDSFAPSEDPMPFIHSMEDNTIKGWMYSPVTGGGTASVEFEYLTGFSTIFQPPHTVAYQLYVKENMPSMAALAGSEGYSTTAYHPYKSSGWNRVLAYDYLDFDRQLFDEDTVDPEYVRKYISDLSDYKMIFRSTEEEDSTFLFTITMQNHSGYAQGWNNLEQSISLPDESRRADPNAEQYFDLVKESDKAVEELIHYYENSDEPTIVVFFGDHQPPLRNAFYEELYGKPLDQRTTEERMQQYAVPFFLWANYDIEERDDVILSPNYLGVLTAEVAGLPLTGYMNFLDQIYEVLPVITPVGIIDSEGNYLKRSELNEEQQDWLDKYETLNYCGMVKLFDEARPMFCAD